MKFIKKEKAYEDFNWHLDCEDSENSQDSMDYLDNIDEKNIVNKKNINSKG